MRPELELNRTRWDEATRFHVRDNNYGLEDFRAGRCKLHRIELEELGPEVANQRLLHLQCHFGLDTLSWARRGAIVTGADFSPEAIHTARALAAETGIRAEFVLSDLYTLHEAHPAHGSYDIVYTSYGVLNWLPELTTWAQQIARYLKPGGLFYIVEGHPTALMFPSPEDQPVTGPNQPWLSYFHDPKGLPWPAGPDYADPTLRHSVGCHEWHHTLGDILNSLITAGLTIEYLHEHPVCAWQIISGLEIAEHFSDSHRYYARPAGEPVIPLMFSLRARRNRNQSF